MSRPCDAEGHYRARISEYGFKRFDSGAASVSIKCELLAMLEHGDDGAEYVDISRSSLEAMGDICVIKKDGAANDPGIQSLAVHAGWNGDLNSIYDKSWMPLLCSVTIKREEYKGEERFKVAFINSWAWIPGGMSNVTREQVAELQAKYGAIFRSFVPAQRPTPPITQGEAWEPQTIRSSEVGEYTPPTMPKYTPGEDIPF